ncbi:N-carbamoyl-L-amino acid hydrolase [miscellaneous Crenarchaeota group-15 archaeon DG-45]|uniref:N-carbamoyl-L-amino acid hydrolase n=1 Tax=miscellaneous Crenarchaeota group-15 archaeon DG-45 TaxID=1685127 RepID=A0A0M0BQ15_9ARCH|nr:MAG: N-carbamoyl-L-amino acid hydrolase [miscellaneous Crenarchaeota group-15 archaeon DG-45]
METNIERVKKDIEAICRFNSTPGMGYTRFSYSPEDAEAREYLLGEFAEAGLEANVDAVGNIRARLEGVDPEAPVVMSGSHIDTVLHGGMFDGLVGTVGALEAVRSIVESGVRTKHPIEVVVFVEEEGSNFGSTTAGSKAMVGIYGLEDIRRLKNDEGVSMYDMAKGFGLDPDDITGHVLGPGEVKAMIELHIEQSVVLDAEGIPIGIVEAIAGIKSYEIELTGVANHAGATPMHMRQDPLAAAAKVIAAVGGIAGKTGSPSTVGTVGRIVCEPNVPNVIPGRVLFTLDARDVNPEGIDMLVRRTEETMKEAARVHGVGASMRLIGESKTIIVPTEMIDLIEESARERGIPYRLMHSGAVHDSCLLAEITDIGMIFAPSIDGRSHVPEESTGFEDVKTGCDLLLDTILKLASPLS